MRDKMGEGARLLHIRDAINYINDFTRGKDLAAYSEEPMMRFAVERQLEIIGEASNHLSPKRKTRRHKLTGQALKPLGTLQLMSILVSV